MFDPKCLKFAEEFLPGGVSDRIKRALAQAIQDAIEEYCVGEAVNLKASLETQQRQTKVEVYSDPSCTFHYCPHPEICAPAIGGCICKRN
jgi:hypothetical protein